MGSGPTATEVLALRDGAWPAGNSPVKMAMDNDMHEVEKDIQAEVLNLDGPFLTLEEFLVAERIKEKLQGASMSEQNAAPGPTADGIRRKRKKKMSPP